MEIPTDDAAERAVLSALFVAPQDTAHDLYDKLATVISETSFVVRSHRYIWQAASSLRQAGKPFGIELLRPELERLHLWNKVGKDDLERAKFLAFLSDGPVPSSRAIYQAQKIAALARRRHLIYSADLVVKSACNGTDQSELSAIVRANIETMEHAVSFTDTEKPLAHIDLADLAKPDDPIPWIVQGWAGEQDIVIVGAEGGMGKSVLGMELALALATGTAFLDLLHTYSGPHRVLMVDEENSPKLSRHRLRQLVTGRGITEPEQLPLHYLSQNSLRLDDKETRALLEREIATFQPAWVMLDTLIRFHAFDENSNSEMARLFNEHLRPLRAKYGCGFFVYHHLAKPSKDRPDAFHRLRGAGDLANMADDYWTLEGDRQTADRTLSCEKCRWRGGHLPQPIALHYEEADDSSSAKITGVQAVDEAEQLVLTTAKVAGEAGAPRQVILNVCQERGLTQRSTDRALGKLVAEGRLERRKEGKETRYRHP